MVLLRCVRAGHERSEAVGVAVLRDQLRDDPSPHPMDVVRVRAVDFARAGVVVLIVHYGTDEVDGFADFLCDFVDDFFVHF